MTHVLNYEKLNEVKELISVVSDCLWQRFFNKWN